MELERKKSVRLETTIRMPPLSPRLILLLLLLLSAFPYSARPQNSRKPELIRDTDIAEGKESPEATEVTEPEPDPLLAEKSFKIGNFYYKRKNYTAAIQRYMEALAYRPDWAEATEALARAYKGEAAAYEAEIRAFEKSGDFAKAIEKCKDFIKTYPDSPKLSDFRSKLSELEKNSR